MATIGPLNTDLGDVQSERHIKDGALFNMPLPGTDSDKALLLDLFGVSRTITVEGTFVDTVANIRTFIGTIEGLIVGSQSGVSFVSSLITSPSSYTVYILSFDWIYVAGDPGKIGYTLNLTQGASA